MRVEEWHDRPPDVRITMINGFCWYELRTMDIEAARAFYADVVKLDIRVEAG